MTGPWTGLQIIKQKQDLQQHSLTAGSLICIFATMIALIDRPNTNLTLYKYKPYTNTKKRCKAVKAARRLIVLMNPLTQATFFK